MGAKGAAEMDLAQHENAKSLSPMGRVARITMGVWLVIVGAALCVSIAGWLVVANAGAGTAASATDPFTGLAAIGFRGAEHQVTGAAAGDPVTQPAAIEFRRNEHDGAGASAADPFTRPAAIEFRNGEHEASR